MFAFRIAMDAVIAMCHFCEIHGPKILFSCQAYHEDASESTSTCDDCAVYWFSQNGKKFYGNCSSIAEQTSNSNSELRKLFAEKCVACASMTSVHPGFLSNGLSRLDSREDSSLFSPFRS